MLRRKYTDRYFGGTAIIETVNSLRLTQHSRWREKRISDIAYTLVASLEINLKAI